MAYNLPLKQKLLGIDYGTKRVGIALSDDEGVLAFPYDVFPQDELLSKKIAALCKEEGAAVIVIGESRDFKQRENPIMPAVRALKDILEKETMLPVYFEPEMLTSAQARRLPSKQEKTRKPFVRVPVDASAAALILQGYIDRIKHQ